MNGEAPISSISGAPVASPVLPPSPPGLVSGPVAAEALRTRLDVARLSSEPATLGGVAVKAANWLVEDIHIKGPALLAVVVILYAWLGTHEISWRDVLAFLGVGIGGAAVGGSAAKNP